MVLRLFCVLQLTFVLYVSFVQGNMLCAEGKGLDYKELVAQTQQELKAFNVESSDENFIYSLSKSEIESYKAQINNLIISYVNLQIVEEERGELSLIYGDYKDPVSAAKKKDDLLKDLGKPPFEIDSYLKFLDERSNDSDFVAYSEKSKSVMREKLIPYRDSLKDITSKISILRSSDELTESLNLKWQMKELNLRKRNLEAMLSLNEKFISNLDYALNAAKEKLKVDNSMVEYIRERLVFKNFELLFQMDRVRRKTAQANLEIIDANKAKEAIHGKIEEIERAIAGEHDIEKKEGLKIQKKVLLFVKHGYSSVRYVNLDLVEAYSLFQVALKRWQVVLSGKTSVKELLDLRAGVKKDIKRIDIWETTLREKSSRLMLDQKELDSYFTLASSKELVERLRKKEDLIETSIKNIGKVGLELEQISDVFGYLIEDIDRIYKSGRVTEKIKYIWKNDVVDMLNWEIWSVNDNPISVIKLLKAITILFMGLFLSRYISVLFKEKLFLRLNIKSYGLVFVESGIFSIGVFFTFMAVLWILHIPLTAFAFLGGAFALAFGLGAQKIFSDLFSGVMLMAQRKLRVGDIVVIDNQWAEVRSINSQNTQVHTYRGHDIIFPNSKLLESQVVNLTLSDSHVRVDISLGVGYDTDMKKAMSMMLSIIETHSEVMRNPRPEVFFTEFGDSSLNIMACFYVNVRITGIRKLSSSIRMEVLDAFRKEKIEIPYPQRDLHMR